jgi:hypothetical protein
LKDRENKLKSDNDMIIYCMKVIEQIEQKRVDDVLNSPENEKTE